MRKQEIDPNYILETTIHISAEIGLENVSTKKISTACGIAEGSIFNHFQSKTNLLNQCLYYIDNDIDNTLSSVPIK